MYEILHIITAIALIIIAYSNLKQSQRIKDIEDYLSGEGDAGNIGGTD